MFVSLKANKKRLVAFAVLVVAVVGACFLLNMKGKDVKTQEYYGGTNEERVVFLKSFGWDVSNDAIETREVMIPESFNDVYTKYNDMQKYQGFDLKPYAGDVCMQYKYQILNYPDDRDVYATLLVYNNMILGGDLACAEAEGFMHGFAADSVKYGEKGSKKSAEKTPKDNTANPNAAGENAIDNNNAGTPGENAIDNNNAGTPGENAPDNAKGVSGEIVVSEDAYPTD